MQDIETLITHFLNVKPVTGNHQAKRSALLKPQGKQRLLPCERRQHSFLSHADTNAFLLP